MDAGTWDARYAAAPLVWSAEPNRFVAEICAALPPGTALDLACGEGRNALWLARLGWQVTAVDFSAVAVDKGRALEARQPAGTPPVRWAVGDVVGDELPAGPYDLVVAAYLQLPAGPRRAAFRRAADSLAPGGQLVLVAHDTSNHTLGTGGPPDPAVLYSEADVRADLADRAMMISRAEVVERPVAGAHRPARDLVVVGRKTA